MNIIPDPTEARELRALYHDNLIINLAEQALRCFGAIDATTAAALLPLWRYYEALAPRECRAVLARFAPDDPDAGSWTYHRETEDNGAPTDEPPTSERYPDMGGFSIERPRR